MLPKMVKRFWGIFPEYVGKDGDVVDLTDKSSPLSKTTELNTIVAKRYHEPCAFKDPLLIWVPILLGSTAAICGIPMGFGGPHAAYFAFKDKDKRSAPGRIIGVSKDA